PQSGVKRAVGTPDSVQALTVLESGARAVYQISGVMPFAQGAGIRLYGNEGVLHYDLVQDRIFGRSRRARSGKTEDLQEIAIPAGKARAWRVEEEFVEGIRSGTPIHLTDFETGVKYMEFTEAVAHSAQLGQAVELPMAEFLEADEE